MATIVNNPSGRSERVVEREDSSGWAVALILIALLVVGGLVFFNYFGAPAPAAPSAPANDSGANINVTVPNPVNDSGGSNNPAPAQ
jgi:hypothetical protein